MSVHPQTQRHTGTHRQTDTTHTHAHTHSRAHTHTGGVPRIACGALEWEMPGENRCRSSWGALTAGGGVRVWGQCGAGVVAAGGSTEKIF